MKNILIDASSKTYETIEGTYLPLDWGMKLHNDYQTYKEDIYSDNNIFCFGKGVLPIIGGHRLIFSFRSPMWKGFHFSAMGGAGYTLQNTGLDNIAIKGRCKKPSLIILNGNGSFSLEFKEIEEFEQGKFKSVYELNDYLISEYKHIDENFRAFLVGPSAITTDIAGIYSQTIKNGAIVEGSEDWAARGGCGSALYRCHNVVGVVFFGDNYKKDIEKEIKLKKIVEKCHNKPYINAVLSNTEKYRYSKKTETGGTFGNNYKTAMDLTPIFNWRTPFIKKEDRLYFHDKILKYFVAQFDKEAIIPKNWTNCGEPCPVACKKYRKGMHVDYEPYEANGPCLGIFDIYAVDKVVHAVDSLGMDAIEFGNLCAWVFELLNVGLLKPEEVGIQLPYFDVENYDTDENILKCSNHNAEQAIALANLIVYGILDKSTLKVENPNIKKIEQLIKLLRKDTRYAANELNEIYNERLYNLNNSDCNLKVEKFIKYKSNCLKNPEPLNFNDFAVYVAFGHNGQISPTMYWAIGNYMPYLIQGKYLTYYQNGVFLEPEELATLSVKGATEEISLENLGICRFHRKWILPVLDELLAEVFKEESKNNKENEDTENDVNYYLSNNIHKVSLILLNKIYEYDLKVGYPHVIESHRVKELIACGAKDFGNEKWAKKFEEEGDKALDEYVSRVLKKYSELLNISWKL
ncbi:aldehyde ferredoxin oxidoreductase N-terminal domain-containing protein [Methanococcus voltae]|uniref:Aldehyde ferredoxin oxidoreductase n=1 Tax=Methanococcus voltae (strain ATCC BAA-1334 / A3) TaxID=456320 RepID=D7DU39_METV3|nr:aldehyde ferredoxin oxidoreductase N-terminal domain-containing protein [Methanococcus voltae]MCS3900449.1 glyceraldehyde-3-phosphate dehydrogenase (ferredoxin) [Methanococcus voltae]